MNRTKANERGKEIFEEWRKKRQQIEKEAKEKGIWQYAGLDTNNHLFKDADEEAKKDIELLKKVL